MLMSTNSYQALLVFLKVFNQVSIQGEVICLEKQIVVLSAILQFRNSFTVYLSRFRLLKIMICRSSVATFFIKESKFYSVATSIILALYPSSRFLVSSLEESFVSNQFITIFFEFQALIITLKQSLFSIQLISF